MNPFVQITLDLLQQPEFRLVFGLFRDSLLAVIGILVLLVLLHLLYYMGQKTPLYRRKPPIASWSRHFFPALGGLLLVLMLLILGMDWLLDYRP